MMTLHHRWWRKENVNGIEYFSPFKLVFTKHTAGHYRFQFPFGHLSELGYKRAQIY